MKFRLWLLFRLFPWTDYGLVANRKYWKFKTASDEITVNFKNLNQPDQLSHEEMVGHLDVFLGRKVSREEIQTVLFWKGNYT